MPQTDFERMNSVVSVSSQSPLLLGPGAAQMSEDTDAGPGDGLSVVNAADAERKKDGAVSDRAQPTADPIKISTSPRHWAGSSSWNLIHRVTRTKACWTLNAYQGGIWVYINLGTAVGLPLPCVGDRTIGSFVCEDGQLQNPFTEQAGKVILVVSFFLAPAAIIWTSYRMHKTSLRRLLAWINEDVTLSGEDFDSNKRGACEQVGGFEHLRGCVVIACAILGSVVNSLQWLPTWSDSPDVLALSLNVFLSTSFGGVCFMLQMAEFFSFTAMWLRVCMWGRLPP